MISKEIPHNQVYECGPSEAIMLPKGDVGRTEKPLVGCIVPIVQYRERIIIGHFGPRDTEKAGIRIGNLLNRVTPNQIFIYYNEMTPDSFWSHHGEKYLELVENMVKLIENITHVSKRKITRHSYPTCSNLHIDWSKTDNPRIYTLPSTDTHI